MVILNVSNNDNVYLSFQLTKSAQNDYQRGRTYLMDLASRQGVQLFDDITEAVMCAVSYLTDTTVRSTPNSTPRKLT